MRAKVEITLCFNSCSQLSLRGNPNDLSIGAFRRPLCNNMLMFIRVLVQLMLEVRPRHVLRATQCLARICSMQRIPRTELSIPPVGHLTTDDREVRFHLVKLQWIQGKKIGVEHSDITEHARLQRALAVLLV
jgi:hypothetical protein